MSNRFEILVKPQGTSSIQTLVQKMGPYHAHIARSDRRSRKEYDQTPDGAYRIVCTNSDKKNVSALLQAITEAGFTLADEKFQTLLVPIATAPAALATPV